MKPLNNEHVGTSDMERFLGFRASICILYLIERA